MSKELLKRCLDFLNPGDWEGNDKQAVYALRKAIEDSVIPGVPGMQVRQEIDDPRKYRISFNGYSIKTGWGDEKRVVAFYPGKISPLDEKQFNQWLQDAEQICELHNATLDDV